MSRMGKFLFACFLFLLLVEPTLVFAQATGVEGTTEDYTGGDSGGSGNLGTLNRTLLDFLNGAIKVLVALTVLVFIFGGLHIRRHTVHRGGGRSASDKKCPLSYSLGCHRLCAHSWHLGSCAILSCRNFWK
ncbi:MAG: hypothetical protein UY14_C0039G0005 [Parcubacteria group bacterium GW2011_GWA1_47_9]|nr:MAG: hypothetical protein UY14_C0039G0005 [Parcubacteria group bacterium GW2011_GWA1_47_9]